MNDKTVDLINKLAAVLGNSAQGIVDAYTWYFIATSIVWLIFGLVLLAVAIGFNKTMRKQENYKDDTNLQMVAWVPALILGFVGLLVVFDNLADLSAPRAAAIHQLLKDISSK